MAEDFQEMRRQLEAMKASLDAERHHATELQVEADAARQEVDRLVEERRADMRGMADSSMEQATPNVYQPLYLAASRKLERFRDKPEKQSDMTVQEWVADIKGHLASRQLPPADQAAFIVDHLVGKARQEILGRGEDVSRDPKRILEILTRVFGDGDTLPLLQQRFFAYRQSNEDLLSCSLALVALYDRIVEQDHSFRACRNSSLKGRLAEAVEDEGLRRELRRLNMECPGLSFFDARDRAMEWLGTTDHHRPKQRAREVSFQETQAEMLGMIREQGQQIQQQQQQLQAVMETLGEKTVGATAKHWGKRIDAQRVCWGCGVAGHFRRDCPQQTNTSGPHQPPNAGN